MVSLAKVSVLEGWIDSLIDDLLSKRAQNEVSATRSYPRQRPFSRDARFVPTFKVSAVDFGCILFLLPDGIFQESNDYWQFGVRGMSTVTYTFIVIPSFCFHAPWR